jgi:uncharacterized phage protein (TIGR02218 family)
VVGGVGQDSELPGRRVVVLRPCSTALAAAFAAGYLPSLSQMADLFTIQLPGGTYRFTSYDSNLLLPAFGGGTITFFAAPPPMLVRGTWDVSNTMQVPSLKVEILDNTLTGFGSSPLSFRALVHNGLLDGGTLFLQRVFMPTPGDTTTYGTVDLFKGDIGAATMAGGKVTLKVRGKNSRLSVKAPRNVYQPSCQYTFCDVGCTLSASSFTASYTILGGSTRSSINIVGGPTSPQLVNGTITVTSGVNSGLSKNIIAWDGFSNITLSYPLLAAPSTGDTATIFMGCDKTVNTCVNTYANGLNFGGFPLIPPPASTSP